MSEQLIQVQCYEWFLILIHTILVTKGLDQFFLLYFRFTISYNSVCLGFFFCIPEYTIFFFPSQYGSTHLFTSASSLSNSMLFLSNLFSCSARFSSSLASSSSLSCRSITWREVSKSSSFFSNSFLLFWTSTCYIKILVSNKHWYV